MNHSCDFCRRTCERRNNSPITYLEVPGYVCEGHIEPGLKEQRDTRMQSEQLEFTHNTHPLR